jgi:hypothetical protein
MSTKLSIEGDSRQGESGTIEVCGILVRRLNKDGFSWESPYDPTADISRREEGIDCEAKDREKVLKVQVTRVETDIWKDLSKNQKAGKISKIKCTVENIWNVILRKSNRIPPDQRKDLVLALDAIETPIYALENVVEAFGNKYGAKTTSLGYEAVWMVGPTEELTYRLDCKIVAQSF